MWFIRIAPFALLALALLLLFLLFGENLLPATEVAVEPVVTIRMEGGVASPASDAQAVSSSDPYAGSVLFQASGWLEADPYPHRATALTDGVIESVFVLEGDRVKAGEPIARLISEDAELQRRQAEANLRGARAEATAARLDYELSQARVESMKRQVEAAEARRAELADLAERATELGPEVVSEQDISQARLRLQTQEQNIAALRAEERVREMESERLAEERKVREQAVRRAEAQLGEAELALDRTMIRAPIDGVIQRLLVAPGRKKVIMADDPESATVALLFDPEHLQARIDVPLADASRLFPGQAVQVESEFLPERVLRGHVQRIVGEADLQRNTLQAKVRIEDPPANWRPDILCRAKFLDTRAVGSSSDGGVAQRVAPPAGNRPALQILVPQRALFERTADTAAVWVVDTGGRHLERRQLTLSGPERDGYVAIREGLRPGDRVVLDPSRTLREGTRVRF